MTILTPMKGIKNKNRFGKLSMGWSESSKSNKQSNRIALFKKKSNSISNF